MSKKKTLGDVVDELVKKHGTSRAGIFVLEMALQKICGEFGLVKINDELLQNTSGYIEIAEKEDLLLKEWEELKNDLH